MPKDVNMTTAARSTPYLFDYNDRVVLSGMAALYLGAMIYGGLNDNLLLALLLGGVFMAVGLACAAASKAGTLSQIALPVLGMALVGLMIHVGRGHAETHFGVFAFLAVLVVYRRSLPIIMGAAAIAVHHLSFNYFQEWGWAHLLHRARPGPRDRARRLRRGGIGHTALPGGPRARRVPGR